MAISTSKWQLDKSKFGMPLDDLVCTVLPPWESIAKSPFSFLKPANYVPGPFDDFSPAFDDKGNGMINIIPFSEMDRVIEDGDIIIFMERPMNSSWATNDWVGMLKQRGWHAEIAYRNQDGIACQCAPWGEEGNEIIEHECSRLGNHRHYNDGKRWNLHIFRLDKNAYPNSNIDKLLAQVHNWRRIFHHYKFPEENWQFDPVDFENLDQLRDIARNLILGNDVEKVSCIQWVYTILSLALNVPLNENTLRDIGVWEQYNQKWGHLGCASNNLQPLGILPIKPYTCSGIIKSFLSLYLRIEDQSLLDPIIENILKPDAVKYVFKGAPEYIISPIVPFSEYRKHGKGSNLRWKYVATAFADNVCIPNDNKINY